MIDLFFDIKRTEIMGDSQSIEDILGKLELDEEDFEVIGYCQNIR